MWVGGEPKDYLFTLYLERASASAGLLNHQYHHSKEFQDQDASCSIIRTDDSARSPHLSTTQGDN